MFNSGWSQTQSKSIRRKMNEANIDPSILTEQACMVNEGKIGTIHYTKQFVPQTSTCHM